MGVDAEAAQPDRLHRAVLIAQVGRGVGGGIDDRPEREAVLGLHPARIEPFRLFAREAGELGLPPRRAPPGHEGVIESASREAGQAAALDREEQARPVDRSEPGGKAHVSQVAERRRRRHAAIGVGRGDELVGAPCGRRRRIGDEAGVFSLFVAGFAFYRLADGGADDACRSQAKTIGRVRQKAGKRLGDSDEGAAFPCACPVRGNHDRFRIAACVELRLRDVFEAISGQGAVRVDFGFQHRFVFGHIGGRLVPDFRRPDRTRPERVQMRVPFASAVGRGDEDVAFVGAVIADLPRRRAVHRHVVEGKCLLQVVLDLPYEAALGVELVDLFVRPPDVGHVDVAVSLIHRQVSTTEGEGEPAVRRVRPVDHVLHRVARVSRENVYARFVGFVRRLRRARDIDLAAARTDVNSHRIGQGTAPVQGPFADRVVEQAGAIRGRVVLGHVSLLRHVDVVVEWVDSHPAPRARRDRRGALAVRCSHEGRKSPRGEDLDRLRRFLEDEDVASRVDRQPARALSVGDVG